MSYPFEDELDPSERDFLKTLTEEEKAYLDILIKQGRITHPNDMVSLIAAFEVTRAGEDEDDEDEDGMFSPEYAEKIGEKDGKPVYKLVIS